MAQNPMFSLSKDELVTLANGRTKNRTLARAELTRRGRDTVTGSKLRKPAPAPAVKTTTPPAQAGVDKARAARKADASGHARGSSGWWTAYKADTARQRKALARKAA